MVMATKHDVSNIHREGESLRLLDVVCDGRAWKPGAFKS